MASPSVSCGSQLKTVPGESVPTVSPNGRPSEDEGRIMQVCSVGLFLFAIILKGESCAPFLAGSAFLRIVLDQLGNFQLSIVQ
jgi:hypothetical protein